MEDNNFKEKLTRENSPMFFKLWDLKNSPDWWKHNIYAITTKDLTMTVWNGSHYPSIEANEKTHICPAGTKVQVWMVSRFGDAGVTDNLVDPVGYNVRGLDADIDLKDYEFILKTK